jgi:hypothetical protein
MVFFNVSSLIGLPVLFTRWKKAFKFSDGYVKEYAAGRRFGTVHLIYKFLSITQGCVELLMGACATIFAIPTFSTCAHIYDCVPREGQNGEIRRSTLAAAPDVNCFEGNHLVLALFVAPTVFLYLFLLAPHAVVSGDTDYVLYTKLFKPNIWRLNAERYATLTYKGFVHPHKQHAFAHALIDLAVKIIVPCLSIWTTRYPLFQMVTLTVVVAAHFAISTVWLHFVDKRTSSFVQGTRLLTFLAMASGIVTVISEGSHAEVATYLLLISCVLVIPGTMVTICWKNASPTAYIDDSPMLENVRAMASFDFGASASEIAREISSKTHRISEIASETHIHIPHRISELASETHIHIPHITFGRNVSPGGVIEHLDNDAVEHPKASSETVTSCRPDPPADPPGMMPDGRDECID